MFSRIALSSPVSELNNINMNGYMDYLPEDFETIDKKANENNFNMMVNQLYSSQLYVNNNVTMNSQFIHPANYQYVLNHQPTQSLVALDTMNPLFSDNSFLQTSPTLEDIPATSTTASTLSDLESLQFIHPQDVVSFPSIHACTPPMDSSISRRSSLLETSNTISDKSFIETGFSQQTNQLLSHPMQFSHSEGLSSSAETTPILSDLPLLHNSLEEVANQKLILPAATNFNNVAKTEHIETINFNNNDESEIYKIYSGERDQEDTTYEEDSAVPDITEIKKFRVVRGISSGGCATRPPKEAKNSTSTFAKVKLHLSSAGFDDMCLPAWNDLEKADRRRIIRIERRQNYADIVASFSIVGSAIDHPNPAEAEEGVDFVEVSCLETIVDDNYDDYESESLSYNEDETLLEDDILKQEQENHRFYHSSSKNNSRTQYYITSVEVIKIVELLIGSHPLDGANRRRERGRVRSNLVPFWSRKPVSSKKNHSASSSPIESKDFRVELAQRIMGYEARKPRGFDKEVRILKWEKLVPALRRALQSYYVEIPEFEF